MYNTFLYMVPITTLAAHILFPVFAKKKWLSLFFPNPWGDITVHSAEDVYFMFFYVCSKATISTGFAHAVFAKSGRRGGCFALSIGFAMTTTMAIRLFLIALLN